MLKLEDFKVIIQNDNVEYWYDAIIDITPKFEIDTVKRIAAFISQCAHESSNFKRVTENLNYSSKGLRLVFPKYFPSIELANKYARNPRMIANRVYANRMGNGDEMSGDGWRYRGRGLIQITGKDNYTRFANYIGMTLSDVPGYMETYDGAVKSACWFWKINRLNRYADKGDIAGLTKAINGGYNGLDDRVEKYKKVLKILS